MKGTMNPKVKICCISSIEEAKMALKYGADALGLVSEMPSGPGVISNSRIRQIVEIIPTHISSFLLTSKTKVDAIIEQHHALKTNTIQIVDKLTEGSYDLFRTMIPHVKLVQVIHVLNEGSITEGVQISKHVDALLLDSGNPNLKVKILGGTGNTHNWDLSKTIREEVDIPVYLAGGLNSSNVKKAINHVKPYGIDLCSSVRTHGALDEAKLKDFFLAISDLGG